VLFLDLDQFKAVNDANGHLIGDDLLVEVARRLQTAVRPSDTLARFGGDEFVIVCEDADVAEAQCVADRLVTLSRTLLK
jgi:diguanylate cyclase (GGDEF)-like protein